VSHVWEIWENKRQCADRKREAVQTWNTTRKGTREKNNKNKRNERNKEQEQKLTIMGVRVRWDFMLWVRCSGGS